MDDSNQAFEESTKMVRQVGRKPKRITLVSAYYPSHGGGMELATADLARTLLDAGHDLRWLAQPDGPLPSGLEQHCIPITGTDIVYRFSGVPLPLIAPWEVFKILRHVQASDLVVIVEANFVSSLMAFGLAKVAGTKTLVVQHVGAPSTVSSFARLLTQVGETFATRPIIRSADEVIYVSQFVAEHFDGLRDSRDSQVIWHGIDTDLFRPANTAQEQADVRSQFQLPTSGNLACFMGRLTESKGILVVRELARILPDWHFAIAGIGPIDPMNWGLGNVTYLGQLDRSSVAELYRSSDTCVLPSQSESFSLVVREALASGCRVVCSEQILETDPQLSAFIETQAVDLADVRATAARFASSMINPGHSDCERAREYVRRNCSRDSAATRYKAIVAGLFDQADRAA
ncbi:glycosyltransferase family 4 protein [Qipengyuania gaetbuli]|uniref:glycosyltransferase family 4 protein n=1 Tax=Qipengyuania gaetbuli TaxID=266952 RepID=UPI001C9991D9|nr:glycosyltransferase family 4 protein [Qipengyuania gaetbuli]MBY6014401.1 glycosyltransferase family 4 protein [Qipengyuania gaetbuli]